MSLLTANTGQILQDLREAKGLSPEEVPVAMLRAGIERRSIPHSRTIRRVEETGRLPQIRYRFGLAQFYDVEMKSLWQGQGRRRR